jgi:ornithine--oxo-acid transaminase
VLIEPIQGEAGIVVPPDGYLLGLRALCDRHRVLLILDEIQSGLGRTGAWFAYEHEGIRPDGVTLGKALGGGVLPVSAFVARREVMDVFTPGSHGSTFGGNPLAAAVGREALVVIRDEGLVARSHVLGERMLARLRAIRSPMLTEVRGRGLWAGAEIDPAQISAREVCERLLAKGVLSKETHGTVVRFAPPLTIARADLDGALDRFEDTLHDIERSRRPPVAA